MLLLLLYLAWFIFTYRAKDMAEPFGSDAVARRTRPVCIAVGKLMGLSFQVDEPEQFDGMGRTFVVAGSPHGSFPTSQVGLGLTRFRIVPPKCIDRYFTAGASVLFMVPGLRELLLILGVREASRRNLRRFLAEGNSVALNPGSRHGANVAARLACGRPNILFQGLAVPS